MPTVAPPQREQRPATARAMARYAAVDGLRGIAILSVLLYHTNWFGNGLFGVDAFFVLSGFLTTLLLIREMERNGRIRVGAFYRRRFKRLMPGLMITLGLVVGVAYLTSPLKEARNIADQAIGSLLQVGNWAQIARGDAYWDRFGAISPLSAMWSLSITEQFYLVWPLVLVVAFALFRRAVLPVAVLTVLLLAGSAAVAPYLWNSRNSDFLYLATHTRAVSFMAGAAAAFVVYLAQRRAARRDGEPSAAVTALLTMVGLTSLVSVVFLSVKVSGYHDAWLYQGGLALIALLIGVLTASLCIERGPLVKALSFKPLMEIGQISYSIYLLHLPVYWLLLMAWPDLKPWALFILGTGLTWLIAMIMHYSIEQVRAREWRASRAVPLFTAGALMVGAGAYFLPTYVAASMRPGGKPLVLTLGDSMAEDFSTALSKHGNNFAVVDGGQGGCGVMSPDKVRDKVGKVLVNWDTCRRWTNFWKDQLDNSGPDAVLIHVGWDAAQQNVRGTWLTPCDPAYRTRYLKQLTAAVDLVHAETPRAQILLMNERRTNGAINSDWGICFNKVVRQYIAKATTSVHLVDLDAFLCPHGQCQQYTPTGLRLYPDGDGVHLTNAGMGYVAPWLEKQISAVLYPGTATKN